MHGSRRAVEQSHVEITLQSLDTASECGLGDMQLSRSFAEAAQFSYQHKATEAVEIDFHGREIRESVNGPSR